jgi:hypothetical protein
MKGVFRAPTPPPSEGEIRRRQGEAPQAIRQILDEDFFPASREDILHGMTGYRVLTPSGEVAGRDLALRLRERVYRTLDHLSSEVEGN